MPIAECTIDRPPGAPGLVASQEPIGHRFIGKLQRLKCVRPSDGELACLLVETVTPGAYTASRTPHQHNAPTRDGGSLQNFPAEEEASP